jgi:hypothetical protein
VNWLAEAAAGEAINGAWAPHDLMPKSAGICRAMPHHLTGNSGQVVHIRLKFGSPAKLRP